MKKIFTLATATLLFAGATFAHPGKQCKKGKDCCDKKEMTKKASDSKMSKATASFKKA